MLHAAAYKHVPLVEANPLASLANNVCSTDQLCRAAVANGVGQVVLISTDKAVPTNVMGASKRLAELVVQAHSAEATSTRFSMVPLAMCSGPQGRWCPCSAARSLPGADHPHPSGDHSLFHDHSRGGHVGVAVVCARPRGCVPALYG